MCGILAGNGYASEGKYKGIAPECYLICGKVLDKSGGGSLKNLIDGLKWISDLLMVYPIRILNISVEMNYSNIENKEEIKIMNGILEYLWKRNVITVVAAGNRGPKPMSLSVVADNGYCICVGCHDSGYKGKNGRCCGDYSGRGPGVLLDYYGIGSCPLKKPDIVAPGTDIISCNNDFVIRGNRLYKGYIGKSGTSMACPIVSGVCALGLQIYPSILNTEIVKILHHTAKDLGDRWNLQGAGMISVDEFLEKMGFLG